MSVVEKNRAGPSNIKSRPAREFLNRSQFDLKNGERYLNAILFRARA